VRSPWNPSARGKEKGAHTRTIRVRIREVRILWMVYAHSLREIFGLNA
jgi:hypothetical protein